MRTIEIPLEAKQVLRRDPVLGSLVGKLEVRFEPSHGSVYADLVDSIIYQQISIKAARSVSRRFCDYFGGRIPAAEALVHAPVSELRALGLSGRKADYVHNIAHFFLTHDLRDPHLTGMPDDEIIQLLTQIKGVGTWTVQMILIFSMGREDVFPALDYGVLSAMVELYELPDASRRDQTRKITAIAENWRPYRTYGTLLVWSWKRRQIGYTGAGRVND